MPFLASAVLVLVGLYVRLQLVETPAFRRSVAQGERVRIPFLVVLAKYPRQLVLGTLSATTIYTVFYLTTVFASGWAIGVLGFDRQQFLVLQLAGVLFLRSDHSVFGHHRRSPRRTRRAADGNAPDHPIRIRIPAAVRRPWRARSLRVPGTGIWPERSRVRSAGQCSCRPVSHRRALHGHIVVVQSCRNTRRLAGAADGHLAGIALRRGVLSGIICLRPAWLP